MSSKEFERVSDDLETFKLNFAYGDLAIAEKLMAHLKASLPTSFKSLPPLLAKTPNCCAELRLARYIHEFAVLLSLYQKDPVALDREFNELKHYYSIECDFLSRSSMMNRFRSRYLVALLEQNRIADFHTELGLLSPTALADPDIKRAVKLGELFRDPNVDCAVKTENLLSEKTRLDNQLLGKVVRAREIIKRRRIVNSFNSVPGKTTLEEDLRGEIHKGLGFGVPHATGHKKLRWLSRSTNKFGKKDVMAEDGVNVANADVAAENIQVQPRTIFHP